MKPMVKSLGAYCVFGTLAVLTACGGGGGGGGGGTPASTTVAVTCPNGTSKAAATLDAANALCPVPTTLSISPGTAATGVSVDTFASVDVTTDSTLDATSITATNITLMAGLTAVPGTISAVGTKSFKFTSTGKLNYGQAYAFSASVKDALGRSLTVSSAFTTASVSCVAPQIPNSSGDACVSPATITCPNGSSQTGATADLAKAQCPLPQVLSISPTNGTTAASVDTFTGVSVTTDSTLDATSITPANITLSAGGNTVSGAATAVSTYGFKFVPTTKLNYGQQYTFSAAVKDTLGRTLTVSGRFDTPAITMPTVSISASQQIALLNEQLTLNWNATNAQNCVLSGDSSGSVGLSGSKTLSYDSVGAKIVSITCAGTSTTATVSANANVMVNAATTYSLPTDLAKVTYPDSYTTVTTKTSDINTDPCNLDLSIVTYPQSWIGSYPLPTIKGAPFPANFFGGMNLKDIMLVDNPTFNRNCKGDINVEFDRTIKRLVSLNVKYVEVPQWHWIHVNQDGSWIVTKAENTFSSLPDANLSYFVSAAHKAGIKVIMMNQIQGIHDPVTGYAYVPDSNLDNYVKWFDAYKAYLQDRGPYFQSIGIDVWELGCSSCIFNNTGTAKAEDLMYFAAQTKNLIPIMRNVFSGSLLITTNPWVLNEVDVINSVDYLSFGIYDVGWGKITSANASAYNVQTASAAILSDQLELSNLLNYDKFGKTLVFDATIQSRASVFTMPGYLEETGCTSSIGNLNISTTSCLQRETSPDFSIQAIFFEAVFESLKSLNLNSKIIPLPSGYWETNSMVSTNVFPNLGSTIRNKPAEGIVKVWFAK